MSKDSERKRFVLVVHPGKSRKITPKKLILLKFVHGMEKCSPAITLYKDHASSIRLPHTVDPPILKGVQTLLKR